MSTEPNTPAPGSPEWLRPIADYHDGARGPNKLSAGLRAAAEEIERLARELKSEKLLCATLVEQDNEFRATNAELEAEIGSLQTGLHNVETENARLRKDEARLDWLEKHGATPICSRAAIDAAMSAEKGGAA